MPRKLILLVLAALALGAVLSARRQRRALQEELSESIETEGNGRDTDAQDSLRKFVEAGERLHGSAPSDPEE
jgi:hypothetical protein